MNTTIYLIRHGEVEYQYNEKGEKMIYGPEAVLSKIGIRQIERLVNKLKHEGKNITVLYSSPFLRARQTAEIIAKKLQINQIFIEKEIRDVYTPGQEKIPLKDINKFKHRETNLKLEKRMRNSINKIISNHQGKTIVIVSHGDPIRVYIDGLLFPDKKELSSQRDQYYLGKGEAWRLIFNNEGRLIQKKIIRNRLNGKSILV